MRRLILLVALGCALPAPAIKSDPAGPVAAPHVEALVDGSTLVVGRLPGAATTSLRIVVRAGGFDDPVAHIGLAHLLEHLIFHGTYDLDGRTLFARVREAGGYVNAFTSTESTVYVLDAPREEFAPLAAAMLRVVTNPALLIANLDMEKLVVDAEHELRGDMTSILTALDVQMFPGASQGRNVIGSKDTRAAIQQGDLLSFYEEHYVPFNTVFVVAGDVEVDAVRAELARSVLWPPVSAPLVRHETSTPNAPSEAKALSWVTATAVGFPLGDVAPEVCTALAGLAELRLRRSLVVDEAVAADVRVLCWRTRGRDVLVATAYTRNLLGSDLPERLTRALTSMHRAPPTPAERASVTRRFAATAAMQAARPGTLADLLAAGASRSGRAPVDGVRDVLARTRLDWSAASAVLQKWVTAKNAVLVHFSPFEET